MKDKREIHSHFSLRKRAEKKLKKQSERLKTLSRQDIKNLVHELGTYQIELEIQNEDLRRSQEQLETSRRKYSDLYNFAPIGYFTLDHNLVIKEMNLTGAGMLGAERSYLLNRPFIVRVAKSDREAFVKHVQAVNSMNGRESCELRLRRRDGSEFYAVLESIGDHEGGVKIAMIDVSDRKNAEDAIRRQADLLNLTQDTIIVRNMQDAIIFWNRGAEETYGWLYSEAVGKISHKLFKTRFPEALGKIMDELLKTGSWKGELVHTKRDGSEIVVSSRCTLQRNESGEPAAILEINTDITERKRMEEAIRFQAFHDPLTGLPNRRLFMDHLSREISHVKRKGEVLAVLFLDLDRFKPINDSLGHIVGDRILQSISDRLKDRMRESDIIARMGGDEFAIVVTNINHPEDATRIADKVLSGFYEPVLLDNREFNLSASIGISMFPQDGDVPEALIKNADIAMYKAKQRGRNNYQFFNTEMNAKSLERLIIETSLRQMLGRGELLVHYQPQIDVRSGRIVAAEALARWKHPRLGLLAPAQFIPLAEESGLIASIDEWVLRSAAAQVREWQKSGWEDLRVSVNLSAGHFHRSGLVDLISRLLKDCDLDPQFLEVEITESVVMQDVETTFRNLKALTAMGIVLAIDDFGTGYSSLSYLRKLSARKLKIDKSFVAGLPADQDSRAVITAIIAMAHSMKLSVIAEGVETEEQCSMLISLGCDGIQGYLIEKPLPTEEFKKLIAA